MKKQYIGIIRDHSASMQHIRENARKDYNAQIGALLEGAKREGIDTIVSVVEVGKYPESGKYLKEFRRDVVNSSVAMLKPLDSYEAPGGSTPLFDGLNDLIDVLESVPDKGSPDVAFLVLVITDGYENVNTGAGPALGKRIKALQGTDHWTFTFRVPYGLSIHLAQQLNIPVGNILEWEQTSQGFERATKLAVNSTQSYFRGRAMGQTMSSSFYANPADISVSTLKKEAEDITGDVSIFVTDKDEVIQPFLEKKTKRPYRPGTAYYKLVKAESRVQGYKSLLLRDRKTLKVYGGDEVRTLLGLPSTPGDIRLKPGTLGQYDVFVQSNSVNRKLPAYTEVVFWPQGGRK